MKKEDIRLVINEGVSDEKRKMIEAYWQMKNGKFVNYVKNVGNRFRMNDVEVTKFVGKNSNYSIPFDPCPECGADLSVKVNSQGAYRAVIRKGKPSCQNCTDKKGKKNQRTGRLYKGPSEAELLAHKIAVAALKLEDLPPLRLQVLSTIVNNNVKNVPQLKRHVYTGSRKDRENKSIEVLHLYGKSLIIYSRKSIMFDEELREKLQSGEATPIVPKIEVKQQDNTLSFTLQENSEGNDPQYKGSFNLKRDIAYKVGTVINYTAHLNSDGTINLKVTG